MAFLSATCSRRTAASAPCCTTSSTAPECRESNLPRRLATAVLPATVPAYRSRRCQRVSPGFPPTFSVVRRSSQLQASPSGNNAWDDVRRLQRSMMEAVAVEDFAQAAKLRDQCKALVAEMPAVQQFLLHTVEKLRMSTSTDEKLAAIRALGEAGDALVVPDLAPCLADEELHAAAQQAMWAVFLRTNNPEVADLMAEGMSHMESLDHERALEAYRKAAAIEPGFAEAHNKMATIFFIMERYEDSLQSVRIALELLPMHFAALSGKGLCHLKLKQYPEALEAMQAALKVNPRMPEIQKMAETLQQQLERGQGLGDT